MSTSPTDRQAFQQEFWNEKARENAHFHILGDPAMWDEAQRDAAFEQAGIADARKLSIYVHPDAEVVDLGCGIGRIAKRLAPLARRVTGCDVSEEMLARARSYLEAAPNVRLVHTDGASLAGVETGGTAFLYSLLCLIHVDKRSAWRTFEEIARVLEPGGLCFLQLQDLLSADGFRKFVEFSRSDYPLEFYAEDEARFLLGKVGLDVLHVERTGEFMNLVAARSDAASWQEAALREIVVRPDRVEGFFAADRIGAADEGTVAFEVRNAGRGWRGFTIVARLYEVADGREAECIQDAQATLHVAPGEAAFVRIRKRAHALDPDFSLEAGRSRLCMPHRLPARLPRTRRVGRHLALIPAGFPWNAATVARFKNSCIGGSVDWD